MSSHDKNFIPCSMGVSAPALRSHRGDINLEKSASEIGCSGGISRSRLRCLFVCFILVCFILVLIMISMFLR